MSVRRPDGAAEVGQTQAVIGLPLPSEPGGGLAPSTSADTARSASEREVRPVDPRRRPHAFDRLVERTLPALVSEVRASGEGRLYRSVMTRVELPLLRHVLALAGGNQLRAARLLGINRNTLRERLRRLGLLPSRGRNGAAPT